MKTGYCMRIDCFGNVGGGCTALRPDCVEEECCFYKNMAEWAAENEASLKTLKERGSLEGEDRCRAILKEKGQKKGRV